MRFSLKFLLVIFALTAVAVIAYVRHRESELGVKFPVPKPVEVDEEASSPPDFIIEIRSKRQVREHDQRLELKEAKDKAEKLDELRLSLKEFSSGYHNEIITEHRDEFEKLARKQINDPDLETASHAAWILDFFGDEDAYQTIRGRYIKKYSAKPQPYYQGLYDFIELFERERLQEDPVFIDFLRSIIENNGSQLDWTAAAFLSYQGIDDEPYYQHMLFDAKRKRDPYYALTWLMEHKLTPEVKKLITQYVDEGNTPAFFRAYWILQVQNEDPDWIPLRNRIEQAVHKYLRKPSPNSWEEQGSHWKKFCEVATEASVDFLSNAIENTAAQDDYARSLRVLYACQALDRLGHREQSEELLKTAIKLNYKDGFNVTSATRQKMFDLAEKLWGREETIKLCKEQIESSRDEGACLKLAEIYAGTRNEEIVSLIKGLCGVKPIEKIGSKRLPEIWKKMERYRANTLSVHQHLEKGGLQRQDIIDWINAELSPQTPLTIPTVIAHPNYINEKNTWNVRSPVVDTDHQFLLMALAHSGKGSLVSDWHDNSRDEVNSIVSLLAESTGKEFDVSSTDSEYGESSFNKYSIVVNGKLYKYSTFASQHIIYDDPEDAEYDARFPIESVLEIMNAIAIRQNLPGRFFYYIGEDIGEYDIDLVAFLTQKQAKELRDKFGLKPRSEFEYYLTH